MPPWCVRGRGLPDRAPMLDIETGDFAQIQTVILLHVAQMVQKWLPLTVARPTRHSVAVAE